ncbi:DUF1439 domain-containing protein [Stenotrophomonas acidaminiphila]|uniref:DUF1439 domain-containing protein n=1 Tax=Stenotrophomonas TaxID=40323 RepID=UPI001354CD99|nr:MULTISPECIES: DUF1439 domain-containing protein [Stenotrophomonas]MTI74476.1 DUF1439 domain-containing protein [Stenotrophomonas sp.]NCT86433.1 DUF1439 domain-containing protein [Stenotrophomonas acidaminiphila]
MNLRTLLLPAVACVVLATSANAAPQVSGRRLLVDAADVQHYLDGSFPRSQKALGGLLAMTVSQPRLTLPAGSRLNLQFDLAMAAAGGAPMPVGNVQLSSGLRYDAQTRGFHLEQPTVDAFRPAMAGAELDAGTRGLLNTWLADYARREPIYRIEPAIANVMGALQVKSVGIENGRIAVDFNQNLGTLLPQGLLGN